MKNNILILLFSIALLPGCEKEEKNPSVQTMNLTDITPSSAYGGGKVGSSGSSPILKKGVCWSLNPNPTMKNYLVEAGSGSGSFNCEINNLLADSTYYLRVFALNQDDTIYGSQIEFKTPDFIVFNPQIKYDSVTDIDGNEYRTVTIGSQTWMAENLRSTRYRNGDPVSLETDPEKWGFFNIKTGAYCWYKNDISKKEIHGAFYNWYAASDMRNIAPEGWHVSTEEDWKKLKSYIDPLSYGNYTYRLFEEKGSHKVNDGLSGFRSNNQTGFTSIPSGKIAVSPFSIISAGQYAFYWTSKGSNDGSVVVWITNEIVISSQDYNCLGYNIRCVKD